MKKSSSIPLLFVLGLMIAQYANAAPFTLVEEISFFGCKYNHDNTLGKRFASQVEQICEGRTADELKIVFKNQKIVYLNKLNHTGKTGTGIGWFINYSMRVNPGQATMTLRHSHESTYNQLSGTLGTGYNFTAEWNTEW